MVSCVGVLTSTYFTLCSIIIMLFGESEGSAQQRGVRGAEPPAICIGKSKGKALRSSGGCGGQSPLLLAFDVYVMFLSVGVW